MLIDTVICYINPKAYPTLHACRHHTDHVLSPGQTLFSLYFHSTINMMKACAEKGIKYFFHSNDIVHITGTIFLR
jgi:hypothetical protein